MKNTREIAKEYRMSYWAGIMRERAESGLSIRAYCAREGMHVNRYHYWQRRLRAAAVECGTSSLVVRAKAETVSPVPAGWTQVTSAAENVSPVVSELTIEIGKCRVSANEGTDTELLAKICKVLVSLC
jgi:hypothetical protein